MQITVLRGGPSTERAVSLVSGKAVADALRRAGHDVYESDIDAANRSGLEHPCDVVFPVLHGTFGESGELQTILEDRGLPFVGSGSRASRIGIDKQESKRHWQRVGLPVPRGELVSDLAASLEIPCVIKPIDGGSSIDVFLCKTMKEARAGLQTVVEKYGRALVEEMIDGSEFTVGIFEDRALHPIRIATSRTFYDYTAKYSGGEQTHHFDLQLPSLVAESLRDLAFKSASNHRLPRSIPHRFPRRSSTSAVSAGDQHHARLHPDEPAARRGAARRHRLYRIGRPPRSPGGEPHECKSGRRRLLIVLTIRRDGCTRSNPSGNPPAGRRLRSHRQMAGGRSVGTGIYRGNALDDRDRGWRRGSLSA